MGYLLSDAAVRCWWLFGGFLFSFWFCLFVSPIRLYLVLAGGHLLGLPQPILFPLPLYQSCLSDVPAYCPLLYETWYLGSPKFLWQQRVLFCENLRSWKDLNLMLDILKHMLSFWQLTWSSVFSVMISSWWWHLSSGGEKVREKVLLLILPSSMQIYLISFFKKFWILLCMGNNKPSVFSKTFFTLWTYSLQEASPSESSQCGWDDIS